MSHQKLGTIMKVIAVLVLALVPANAAQYLLTIDHCGGGCNPGAPGTSMGTVDVVQNGTNDVRITITLVSPLKFVNTGLDSTIDFNIVGTPTISIPNLPAGFVLTSATAGSHSFDGFGNFQYAITTNTGQGAGGSIFGPVSFDVVATGLTPASFATTGTEANVFFGVDVYNTRNGNTGPIGGSGGGVPEPTSIAFFGTGLLGAGFLVRRRLAGRHSSVRG